MCKEADVEGVLKKDVEFHEKIFSMANNKKLYQLINLYGNRYIDLELLIYQIMKHH